MMSKTSAQRATYAAGVAAVALALSSMAYGDTAFEMKTSERDMFGSANVNAGEYEKGIQRLERMTESVGQSHKMRVTAFTDLCVAHTMERNLEAAEKYCRQAIETGWELGSGYNNLGVLNVAKGNYEAALRNFEQAAQYRDGGLIAKRNLKRARISLAAIRGIPTDQLAANDEGSSQGSPGQGS
jgi:Flp pilus assembly protein TadD